MSSSRFFPSESLTSRPGMRYVASCALGCCPFYSTGGHSASCAKEVSSGADSRNLGLGSGSGRALDPKPGEKGVERPAEQSLSKRF